jgi:iron complex outermembrane receptor protein
MFPHTTRAPGSVRHPAALALALLTVSLVPLSAQTAGVSRSTLPEPADQPTLVLSPFEVRAEEDRGYRATTTISASRLATELRDTPLTVNVLTEEIMKDLAAYELNDALNYVAGFRRIAETENAYVLRGQRVNYAYRNGFPRYDFSATANIQRIEVVKGPAAILYGLTFPGGVINYITKRPHDKLAATVEAGFGSWDFYRGMVDVNVPLGDKFAYRAVGSYQKGGSIIDVDDPEIATFANSLSWRPLDGTRILIDYDYARKENNPWPFGRTGFTNIPLSRATVEQIPIDAGGPANGFKTQHSHALSAELEQKLNDWLIFRAVHNFTWRDERTLSWGLASILPDYTVPARAGYNNRFRNWDRNSQAEFVANLTLGGLTHRVLLGAQYNDLTFRRVQRSWLPAARPTFSIFKIPLLPTTDPNDERFFTAPSITGDSNSAVTGYYLTDTIKALDDRLHILGGIRFTEIHQKRPLSRGREVKQDNTAPQIGASYRLSAKLSAYAVYSESLQPQIGINPDGQIFPNLGGEGWDAGIKLEAMEGRLSLTAAVFESLRTNAGQNDPARPGYRIFFGETSTAGFEFDLFFAPIRNISLVMNYQYMGKAEITNDANPANIGQPLGGVPEHTGSFVGRYRFAEGRLEGFGFGGGVTYSGTRNDGYPAGPDTSVDVFFDYETKLFGRDVTCQLNVRNIFDEIFYPAPGVTNAPRNFVFTTRFRF